MMVAMSVLGFALGLSQTTTMDWVVNLVEDTSRGSALGLRVATNRVGQTFILAVAGAVSGVWGVEAASASWRRSCSSRRPQASSAAVNPQAA